VVKNVPEVLRRLEIRLPAGHWIFTVSARERAAYIRQALDMALLINKRFDRVEEMMRHDPVREPWAAKATREVPKEPGNFVADILNTIADL
jgi:hypothetical protein